MELSKIEKLSRLFSSYFRPNITYSRFHLSNISQLSFCTFWLSYTSSRLIVRPRPALHYENRYQSTVNPATASNPIHQQTCQTAQRIVNQGQLTGGTTTIQPADRLNHLTSSHRTQTHHSAQSYIYIYIRQHIYTYIKHTRHRHRHYQ